MAAVIIIVLAVIYAPEKSIVIHKLVLKRTPASNHEPLLNKNNEKWYTEFNYLCYCPEPRNFNLEVYCNDHPEQLVIKKKIADENIIVLYTNTFPDQNIFPFPIKWGKVL
jgi:hypothetical protein